MFWEEIRERFPQMTGRTANLLGRRVIDGHLSGMTDLLTRSDVDLLALPGVGLKALAEIRRCWPAPMNAADFRRLAVDTPDKYGDRIPTHEDMLAVVKVIDALGSGHHGEADEKPFDLLAQVIVSYCRQFRDVAGPEED